MVAMRDTISIDEAIMLSRKQVSLWDSAHSSATAFVENANQRFGSLLLGQVLPLSLPPIRSLGLPGSVGHLLEQLIDEGSSEEDVMRALWAAFALFLDPASTKRGLARKLKAVGAAADQRLVQRILGELRSLEVTS
jgi:hypothetical protein